EHRDDDQRRPVWLERDRDGGDERRKGGDDDDAALAGGEPGDDREDADEQGRRKRTGDEPAALGPESSDRGGHAIASSSPAKASAAPSVPCDRSSRTGGSAGWTARLGTQRSIRSFRTRFRSARSEARLTRVKYAGIASGALRPSPLRAVAMPATARA